MIWAARTGMTMRLSDNYLGSNPRICKIYQRAALKSDVVYSENPSPEIIQKENVNATLTS